VPDPTSQPEGQPATSDDVTAHPAFAALYQSLWQDLRHYKSQQWRVMYYVSLVYVAIVAGAALLSGESAVIFLGSLGVPALAVGLIALSRLEEAIERDRSRLHELNSKLGPALKEIAPAEPARTPGFTFGIMAGALVLGLIAVWWYLIDLLFIIEAPAQDAGSAATSILMHGIGWPL
jgi:hypothetical protein